MMTRPRNLTRPRTCAATRVLALAPLLLAAPVAALAQDGPTGECDPVTGRCVGVAVLNTEAGERFGTVGLQIGKDGSDPVLFAISPLGVAVQPGLRVVTDGAGDHELAIDACFPDGCRATLALDGETATAVIKAARWSLQFFPFGADKPLSADLDPAPLIEALRAAGATLP